MPFSERRAYNWLSILFMLTFKAAKTLILFNDLQVESGVMDLIDFTFKGRFMILKAFLPFDIKK